MNWLDWILLFFGLQLIFIIAGLLLPRKGPKRVLAEYPLASVVVAVRNEEENVADCLKSLLDQTYPEMEIIAVEDRSTDKTAEIIEKLSVENPRLRMVRIRETQNILTGKENALEHGIASARGDWVLMTDADCRAHPSWVEKMMEALTAGNDLVFGETQIAPASSIFEKFQALELNLLFKVAFSLERWKMAGSCMGNNLGIRKKAFLEIGGYRGLGFEPAEDYALLRVFQKRNFRISALSGFCRITTRAESGFQSWANQRIRWMAGSMRISHPLAWAILPMVLVNTGILLQITGFFTFSTPILLFCLLAEGFLLCFRTPRPLYPLIFPVFLYSIAAAPVYAFLYFIKRRIEWKNESVRIR